MFNLWADKTIHVNLCKKIAQSISKRITCNSQNPQGFKIELNFGQLNNTYKLLCFIEISTKMASTLKSHLEKKDLKLMSDLKFLLKTESLISTRADWHSAVFVGPIVARYLNVLVELFWQNIGSIHFYGQEKVWTYSILFK